MDEKLKILLYRSFDEDLNPEESEQLARALSQSEKLRNEKAKIIDLRRTLREGRATTFKPFFADRVFNRIQASTEDKSEESFFESLFVVFRPVAIAAAILIIIITAYNISSSGQVSIEGALAVPEVTLDDAYDSSLALVMEE